MTLVARERLPGLLGHELRNPLASAMTGAMLARDMVDADDPRAAVLDGVLRDLDRITGLVDGWLALARDSRAVGRRIHVAEFLAAMARRHRAKLVCCPAAAYINGNRALLERVIDNLCDNARNAGAAVIRIAAQCSGNEVSIHIEDDGCGVRAEDVERLFEPGWTQGGGCGLGLHAAAVTIEAHGGHIACVPIANGTRFTVCLPLAQLSTS